MASLAGDIEDRGLMERPPTHEEIDSAAHAATAAHTRVGHRPIVTVGDRRARDARVRQWARRRRDNLAE